MTSLSQATAQIYQFPVGGRAALTGRREAAKAEIETGSPRVDVGSGWYHEEAIEEARRGKDH